MDANSEIVEINSVVQINENGQEGWRGCFVQVSEVKKWGIQGWVEIPMQGSAYTRLRWDQIDYIGEAIMTRKGDGDDGDKGEVVEG